MDLFAKFKESLQRSLGSMKKKDDPSLELLSAVGSSDNWDELERHLVEARTLSRKRQQEIVERLEPIGQRIEGLLAEAKKAKIKTMKQNLLRQAEGYIQELEAEDEPAKVHSANCRMLTNIIKQVQRARAVSERGITVEAIDTITSRLEEIVVDHESALEAASELEEAGQIGAPSEVTAANLEKRLSVVYETGAEEEDQAVSEEDADAKITDVERKLYEE